MTCGTLCSRLTPASLLLNCVSLSCLHTLARAVSCLEFTVQQTPERLLCTRPQAIQRHTGSSPGPATCPKTPASSPHLSLPLGGIISPRMLSWKRLCSGHLPLYPPSSANSALPLISAPRLHHILPPEQSSRNHPGTIVAAQATVPRTGKAASESASLQTRCLVSTCTTWAGVRFCI